MALRGAVQPARSGERRAERLPELGPVHLREHPPVPLDRLVPPAQRQVHCRAVHRDVPPVRVRAVGVGVAGLHGRVRPGPGRAPPAARAPTRIRAAAPRRARPPPRRRARRRPCSHRWPRPVPRGAPGCPIAGPRARPAGNRHPRPRSRRGPSRCRRAPPGPGPGGELRECVHRRGGQVGAVHREGPVRPAAAGDRGTVGERPAPRPRPPPAVARSSRSPGLRSGQHRLAVPGQRPAPRSPPSGSRGRLPPRQLTAQPARRREVCAESSRRRQQPVHHGWARPAAHRRGSNERYPCHGRPPGHRAAVSGIGRMGSRIIAPG